MKKIIVLIVFVLPFVCKAQTTVEEYNYLTKGYAIQIESGLDMKAGYKMINVTDYIKKLVRIRDESIAGYLYISTFPYTDENEMTYQHTEYICIPHPKSEETVLALYASTIINIYMLNASELVNIIVEITNIIKF